MSLTHNKVHFNTTTIDAPKQNERFTVEDENTVRLNHIIRGKGFKNEKSEQCYEVQREVNCQLDFTGITREELIEIAASKVYYDMKPDDDVDDVVSVREWYDAETKRNGGKRGPAISAKAVQAALAQGKTAEEIIAELLAKSAK